MPDAVSDARVRRDLNASVRDAFSYSVMVGAGETYIPAFALFIGAGEVAAGLVATVPMLAGAALQLISPLAVRRLGSHRVWTVGCAALQGLSFVPLVLAAAVGAIPTWALFAAAGMYWGCGMGCGAAWNTWIGTLVPAPIRARFFARRTRLAQVGVVLGLAGGGLLLQRADGTDWHAHAFLVLFAVAGLGRLASAAFLASQSEPEPMPESYRTVGPGELLRRLGRGSDVRLLTYMLSVQFAAQLAGPYFTPFMLDQLHFSYATYMALLATAYVVRVLAMPLLGHLAHQFGSRTLLWIGGALIGPSAAIWSMTQSLPVLFATQVLVGFAWGSYELATFLMFFEAIRADERTSVLTTFNFANALAVAGGAVCGGFLLHALEGVRAAYLTLFALSAALRFAALMLLAGVPRTAAATLEVRSTEPTGHPPRPADTPLPDATVLASSGVTPEAQ